MWTEHRPRRQRRWPTHIGLAALVGALSAGCGDDAPACSAPTLTNEQEAALVRTTLATTEGMVATAQDTTAAEIVAIASDFETEHDELVDRNPCDDRTHALIGYQLVIADLAANTETISPELATGLTRAASEGGATGVLTFLTHSDVFYSNEYAGLAEMRDRIRQQRDQADEVFEALTAEPSSSDD